MEDYTSKYKGEAVELALFGGEYQDGVLTAYCYIEDVPHVELNGHILVPLQNVASLHCSGRCDAQDDWPPRGLLDEDEPAVDALVELSSGDLNRGLVVENGHLAGLLSISDLSRALEVRRRTQVPS